MTQEILHDRYLIVRQLGKKSGRETLLAQDLKTQQNVVIKRFIFGSNFAWEDLKRFEGEAETLKSLSHPCIPRYIDFFEIDTPSRRGVAFVRSYIEAKSLQQYLDEGQPFTERQIKQIIRPILEILAYIHKQKPSVIHRDIKPSNILLSKGIGYLVGQVYLVDFGLVQTLVNKKGKTIPVVGTYGYMPPEQFGGCATPASDLYSLGATLFYLITGRYPSEPCDRDLRIQSRNAVANEKSFADWLQWMTEPSLENRPGSAEEALQALSNPRIKEKDPIIFKQPVDSEVILVKTPESHAILFPAKGIGFGEILLLLMALPIGLHAYYGTWLFEGQRIFPAVLSILLLVGALFAAFQQIRFVITHDEISFTHELFGWEFHQVRVALPEEASKASLIFSDVKKPRLVIQVGKKKYKLHQIALLNKAEIRWLVYELCHYINLTL